MNTDTDNDIKRIVIISDGTGRTAKRLMDAVLAQYEGQPVRFKLDHIYSGIRTVKQLDRILENDCSKQLLIFSIVSNDLRKYFHKRLHEEEIIHLNVLEPMLSTMSKFLGFHPEYKPGLLQIIDDRYYKKVDAIGFTVEHDDGLGHQIQEAKVVLVGLSRTCKTPISMYLACNYGVKVANIPVIADENAKQHLLDRVGGLDDRKIFGVMLQPETLVKIREERSTLLGGSKSGKAALQDYHDISYIYEEVKFFKKLCNEQGWEIIDVTKRAIEEISSEIIARIKTDFDYHHT